MSTPCPEAIAAAIKWMPPMEGESHAVAISNRHRAKLAEFIQQAIEDMAAARDDLRARLQAAHLSNEILDNDNMETRKALMASNVESIELRKALERVLKWGGHEEGADQRTFEAYEAAKAEAERALDYPDANLVTVDRDKLKELESALRRITGSFGLVVKGTGLILAPGHLENYDRAKAVLAKIEAENTP